MSDNKTDRTGNRLFSKKFMLTTISRISFLWILVPIVCIHPTGAVFKDVSKKSGVCDIKPGGMATWNDYDNDGDWDLLISNTDNIYRNTGRGVLMPVAGRAGAAKKSPDYSNAWADYDNDGHIDLYLCLNKGPGKLYRNSGDGSFQNTAAASGIGYTGSARASAWGDYDNDGDMDLYIARGAGKPDILYENRTDGSFLDVTSAAAISIQGSDTAHISWVDFDNDGLLDIFVLKGSETGEDTVRCYLLRNRGNKSFADVTGSTGLNKYIKNSAGRAVWADYNNDGFMDLLISGADCRHRLLSNRPNRNHWIKLKLTGTQKNPDGIGARITVTTSAGRQYMRSVFPSDTGRYFPMVLFGLGPDAHIEKIEIVWPSGIKQMISAVPPDRTVTLIEPEEDDYFSSPAKLLLSKRFLKKRRHLLPRIDEKVKLHLLDIPEFQEYYDQRKRSFYLELLNPVKQGDHETKISNLEKRRSLRKTRELILDESILSYTWKNNFRHLQPTTEEIESHIRDQGARFVQPRRYVLHHIHFDDAAPLRGQLKAFSYRGEVDDILEELKTPSLDRHMIPDGRGLKKFHIISSFDKNSLEKEFGKETAGRLKKAARNDKWISGYYMGEAYYMLKLIEIIEQGPIEKVSAVDIARRELYQKKKRELWDFYHRNKRKKMNVIIILIDALRPDHMGIYGYHRDTTPHIDKFARKSIIFDRTYSSAQWTIPSIAALFSASYPDKHNVYAPPDAKMLNKLPANILTLAESMRQQGFITSALTTQTWLQPDLGFDQGFDDWDVIRGFNLKPVINLNPREGEWLNDAVFESLDELKNSEYPFFLYLHYMGPHVPYVVPPEFSGTFPPHKASPELMRLLDTPDNNLFLIKYEEMKAIALRGDLDPDDVNYMKARYDEKIFYTDWVIKQLFDKLETLGFMENTMIILTSDHGEAFNEHNNIYHTCTLYEEEIRVPLIIYCPSLPLHKMRVGSITELIDIYPTILDIMGCRVPGGIHGTSMLEAILGLKRKPFAAALGPTGGDPAAIKIITEDWTAIFNYSHYKMYNLAEDKHEKNPIKKKDAPDIFRKLHNKKTEFKKRLNDALIQNAGTGVVESENKKSLDPEIIEKLKSLGYLQ